MSNQGQFDQHAKAIYSEIGERLRFMLPAENGSPDVLTDHLQAYLAKQGDDQQLEQEALIMRYRLLKQEATDPLADGLLEDIISELEAEYGNGKR